MSLLTISNLSVPKPDTGLVEGNAGNPELLLENINCEIEAGEILAVIGPNGAGKSTLYRAVSGEIAHQGKIDIEGLSNDANLKARQCSFLPQYSSLDFPFQVCEVVNLARTPHQTGRQRDEQIIDQALELMDISHLKERPYTRLSGGEKQRVQLARVFAQIWDEGDAPNGTRLLVLDEPTAALDLGHQKQLMRAIRTFADQGVAVLMILHNLNLAAQYADKLLALLDSQVVAYGDPDSVITEDNISRLFETDVEIMAHPRTDKPVVIAD